MAGKGSAWIGGVVVVGIPDGEVEVGDLEGGRAEGEGGVGEELEDLEAELLEEVEAGGAGAWVDDEGGVSLAELPAEGVRVREPVGQGTVKVGVEGGVLFG